jgi:hypothetical protein
LASGEKIAENKKAGLSFRIPLDWKIEIKEYQAKEPVPKFILLIK